MITEYEEKVTNEHGEEDGTIRVEDFQGHALSHSRSLSLDEPLQER